MQDKRHTLVYIYECLLTLGYPNLIHTKVLTTDQQIQTHCSMYIHPAKVRLHLLAWLACVVCPSLDLPSEPTSASLCDALWRIGALPVSLHTKNLDYVKYVEGLLGVENSICLLHLLCRLAMGTRGDCKDRRFDAFFTDIMEHYEELVEENYDPYGVVFPAAYDTLPRDELRSRFQKKVQQVKGDKQREKVEIKYEEIFSNIQREKERFIERYNKVVEHIEKWVLEQRIDNNIVQRGQQFQNRTLKIPLEMSEKYQQYKKVINIPQFIFQQTGYIELKKQLQALNDQLSIE